MKSIPQCFMHALLTLLIVSSPLAMADAASAVNQCAADANWVKANYILTETRGDDVRRRSLILWRKPNVVAHEYPANHITQMWEHVHERVKPTRFFDAHQRAIEYQPGEMINGRIDNDWEYRNQLVTLSFIDSLDKGETTGEGCETTTRYYLKDDKQHIELVWLERQQLIASFSVIKGNEKMQWQQQSLSHSQSEINAFFDRRATFQTTDYADIGDDHTDPFLTNMVHQGFIEAAASGFYDANGNALKGGHHH